MSDISAIERRNEEVQSRLVPPTQAERDRQALLDMRTGLRSAMREALIYLKGETHDPDVSPTEAAIEALKHGLEQM